jgi:hypothetical protein
MPSLTLVVSKVIYAGNIGSIAMNLQGVPAAEKMRLWAMMKRQWRAEAAVRHSPRCPVLKSGSKESKSLASLNCAL